MKIPKKQYKKIRRQAILDVLLYQAFILVNSAILIYGIIF